MKSFLIVGLGRFGTAVACRLQELGHEVMVIDEQTEKVQRISDDVTYAVVGDARDEDVLESIGARNVDCAIVAIGDNLAANILVTLNLKSLGVRQVICKAKDDQQRRALEKVGADRVLIPEREMGLKLAQNLSSNSVLDYIELSSQCGIVEIRTPAPWVGKNLRSINVRAKYGVTVIAIRTGSEVSVSLDPDCLLAAEDILVILGDNDRLTDVQNL
ncbi:MAG: TrkA family potassium uptake protein [Oscillospiraceae bacterium]|nr:TrkA family potassium uptake protein [Oscillospiraceae bacterium]